MTDEHKAKHSGRAAEEAKEAAERALRGEHSPIPPSDLPDGKHERSHAAHLKIEEAKPKTKPQGDLSDEKFSGSKRLPSSRPHG
jgi:2-methylcitrate dehydratase PrpD